MRGAAGALAAAVVLAVGLAGCGGTDGAVDGGAPATGAPVATSAPVGTTPPPGVRPSPGCATAPAELVPSPAPPATGAGASDDGGAPLVLTVDGVERRATVYRPASEPSTPVPLVLVFHGHGEGPAAFATLTDLPRRGTAAGFEVVMAEGLVRGADGKRGWQANGAGEDAAYVDALRDDLGRHSCLDLARVYLTGFSAGAAFTLAYTCRHQDDVAAMATVAVDFQLGCTQPTSLLAFHGTDDIAVPYQDGAQGLSLGGVKVRGTELNLGDWAALGHCSPDPEVRQIDTEVVHRVWQDCAPGTDVELYTILGGGHAWPGADPARAIGLTTQQISATDLALAFFADHHR